MSDTVLTDTRDGVRTITLHRPERRNALSADLASALATALRDAESAPEVVCVILTGADPAFCAGVDLRDVADGRLDVERMNDISISPWEALARMRTPVIGAVNGPAVAQGLELLLRCHFLIASERACFADTHARVGIHPGAGLTGLLPQAVGLRRARQMSLTGDFLGAEEALRFGLVNEVVDHDRLLARCTEIAGAIGESDPEVVRTINDTYRQVSETTLVRGLALEYRRFREWEIDVDAVDARRRQVVRRGREQAGEA